jgi:hypothetical protein
MSGLFASSNRPRLLAGTVKIVAAITLLSLFAARYLADGSLDQSALTRLAAQAAGEPTTTGSILKSAATAKLDPCKR